MLKLAFSLLTSIVIYSISLYAQTYDELCKDGDSKFNKGDYVSAIKDYEAAMKINRKESYPYFMMGYIYQTVEINYKKAIANYQKALKINPKDCNSLGNLCGIYINNNQYKKIKTICSDALKLEQDCPDAFLYYAMACEKAGEIIKASEYFLKAIAVNPDDQQINLNVGLFYSELGLEKEATKYLIKALKLGNKTAGLNLIQRFHSNYPEIFYRLDHDIKYPDNKAVYASYLQALGSLNRNAKGLSDPEVLQLIIKRTRQLYGNLSMAAFRNMFPSSEFKDIEMINNFTDEELEVFALLAANYQNN